MVVVIENVTKTIKNSTVVDSVSFRMESGSITGLRGINGSGKTMLMRLMSGLIKPTEGCVSINGKILWKDISFPESMGILIENPAFLDSYSALENLKLIARVRGIAKEDDIKQTLMTVGLDPESKKKYKKFSLGMKQRLGIAAAIMEKPDLLLLDEPTNALDASGVAMLKEIVQERKNEGTLVVITCHDTAILSELSDEIYCLEEGKIIDHITVPDNGSIPAPVSQNEKDAVIE